MKKLKLKDEVIVVAGKDKGKTGTISKINWKKSTVLVDGVNLAKKAIKASQENPNGGFATIEAPLSISNIALKSPKTGKGSKVGIKVVDGKKVRYLKKCDSILN